MSTSIIDPLVYNRDAQEIFFNPAKQSWGQALLSCRHLGDGADAVCSGDLDPWQKFAHDVVVDSQRSPDAPLRMMLMGSAGTGKSRTVRAFVTTKRQQARAGFEDVLQRVRLRARGRADLRKVTDTEPHYGLMGQGLLPPPGGIYFPLAPCHLKPSFLQVFRM